MGECPTTSQIIHSLLLLFHLALFAARPPVQLPSPRGEGLSRALFHPSACCCCSSDVSSAASSAVNRTSPSIASPATKSLPTPAPRLRRTFCITSRRPVPVHLREGGGGKESGSTLNAV